MKILSHDMRSPLNGIIGIGELLLNLNSFQGDEETQELLLNLKYSSEQLNQLISDILNYTVIGGSGFKLERKPTRVGDIVSNLQKLYKSAAALKNIDLQFTAEDVEETVQIDAEKFKQIFGNLISNAIKFTHEGGRIRFDAANNSLVLIVKDNGVGMDEKTVQKILNGKSPSTTLGTDGEKGTGLGTTIIYKFTKLHEGGLYIESTPGEGTSVTVTIPLSDSDYQ
jgi:signal transduction histidine kinase